MFSSKKEEKKLDLFFQKTFWPLFINEKFGALKEMQNTFQPEETFRFFQWKGPYIFEISLIAKTLNHFEFLMENFDRKIILLGLNCDVLKTFCIILNGYEENLKIGSICKARLRNLKKKLDFLRNLDDPNISCYLDSNILASVKDEINKL